MASHQVLAYHAEAVEELWPFDLSWDADCWWASQWHQSLVAAVKFRGHVLVSKEVVIANPRHEKYPSGAMIASYNNASAHFRAQLPPERAHCARFVNDTCRGLPWGELEQCACPSTPDAAVCLSLYTSEASNGTMKSSRVDRLKVPCYRGLGTMGCPGGRHCGRARAATRAGVLVTSRRTAPTPGQSHG